MRPIRVEVVSYAPTFFSHCQHCELAFRQMGVGEAIHGEQARESLPQDLRFEFETLSLWAHRMIERFGDRIRIKLVDAASIEGIWKSLRYRAWRYPLVVVDGTERYMGADLESAWQVVERRVMSSANSGPVTERRDG